MAPIDISHHPRLSQEDYHKPSDDEIGHSDLFQERECYIAEAIELASRHFPVLYPGGSLYRGVSPSGTARQTGPSDGDSDLEDIFAAYVERLNAGEELDPEKSLADHPAFGADIIKYLEGARWFHFISREGEGGLKGGDSKMSWTRYRQDGYYLTAVRQLL